MLLVKKKGVERRLKEIWLIIQFILLTLVTRNLALLLLLMLASSLELCLEELPP